MNLQAEEVEYNRKEDPRPFLITRGGTEEEADFLVRGKRLDGRWLGRRVELNAMTSDEFIHWLERKLQEHGVTKFVPSETRLQAAWMRAWRIRKLNEVLARAVEELGETPEIPPGLADRVQRYMKENPSAAWDMALTAPEVQS